MKKSNIFLTIVLALALSLAGCGANKIELQYTEDSYEADFDNIFDLSWDALSLFGDAEDYIKENWFKSTPVVKGETMSGLFSEKIKLVVDDSGEKTTYEYDSEDIEGIEDDPDKAVVDTLDLEDGKVKVVLVDCYGDDESFDFEVLLFSEETWDDVKYDYLDFDFYGDFMEAEFEFEVVNNE